MKWGASLYLPFVQPDEVSVLHGRLEQGLAAVKRAGFDFAELSLAPLANLREAALEQAKRIITASGLPVPAFSGFFPPQVPVTGPEAQLSVLEAYMGKALPLAKAVGAEVLVLGGGKVRSVPDGFPKEEGVEQLARFLASAEEAAAKEELLLALEPLNRKETNVVKRLEDAVELAARLYLPHVRVAADSYHMLIEREEADMLEEAVDLGLLAYVHIADRDRRFPGQPVERGVDYEAFFRTLKSAGYEGRICLECGYETVEELERLGTDALRFVKDQWELA